MEAHYAVSATEFRERLHRLLDSVTLLHVHQFAEAGRPITACFLAQRHGQIISRETAEDGQTNEADFTTEGSKLDIK